MILHIKCKINKCNCAQKSKTKAFSQKNVEKIKVIVRKNELR